MSTRSEHAGHPPEAIAAGRPSWATLPQFVAGDLARSARLGGARGPKRFAKAVGKLALYPRVRGVVWFRVSQVLWQQRLTRPLALLVQGRTVRLYGSEIHPAALVGPGLDLEHSVGIVVGARSRIGRDCSIFQGVTLGNRRDLGQPTIGDGVRLGAGALILGPVTIGDGARIGAGSVVLSDVPAGWSAVGNPAVARQPGG